MFFLAKAKQPKTKRVKHYYVGEDWVFGDIMMMNRVQLFAFQSKCVILPRDEKCLFFTAHRHPVIRVQRPDRANRCVPDILKFTKTRKTL